MPVEIIHADALTLPHAAVGADVMVVDQPAAHVGVLCPHLSSL